MKKKQRAHKTTLEITFQNISQFIIDEELNKLYYEDIEFPFYHSFFSRKIVLFAVEVPCIYIYIYQLEPKTQNKQQTKTKNYVINILCEFSFTSFCLIVYVPFD